MTETFERHRSNQNRNTNWNEQKIWETFVLAWAWFLFVAIVWVLIYNYLCDTMQKISLQKRTWSNDTSSPFCLIRLNLYISDYFTDYKSEISRLCVNTSVYWSVCRFATPDEVSSIWKMCLYTPVIFTETLLNISFGCRQRLLHRMHSRDTFVQLYFFIF